MRVIGLMSGTSYDAHRSRRGRVQLSGDTLRMRPLGRLSHPYSDELRDAIAAALPPAATTTEAICALDTGIGQAFAEAGVRALARTVRRRCRPGRLARADHAPLGRGRHGSGHSPARSAGLDRGGHRPSGRVRPAQPRRRRRRPGRSPGRPLRRAAAGWPARRPGRAEPGRHRQHHRRRSGRGPARLRHRARRTRSSTPPSATSAGAPRSTTGTGAGPPPGR